MEKYEPIDNNTFSGFIANHQNDYNISIKYKSNNANHIHDNYWFTQMFTFNSIYPSAFTVNESNYINIEIEIINQKFLITHYQMQQRTDVPSPSGCFTSWVVDGRSDKIGWKRIDTVNDVKCETKMKLLRTTSNIVLNKIRFIFDAKHITIQQIDFYGVLGKFNGHDEAYICQTLKQFIPSLTPIFFYICFIDLC